jgi:hypothetical protein
LHDWLLRLEAQRYAASSAAGSVTTLPGLKKQYAELRWPV